MNSYNEAIRQAAITHYLFGLKVPYHSDVAITIASIYGVSASMAQNDLEHEYDTFQNKKIGD